MIETPPLSPVDKSVVALMRAVRTAKEQEITACAAADFARDAALTETVSYSSILTQEARRLGDRMLWLYRHPLRARFIGQQVISPEFIKKDPRTSNPSPDLQRAQIHMERVREKMNRDRQWRMTELRTPLLLLNDAEYIEGAAVVHGWYVELVATGGNGPKQHTPTSVSIVSSYRDAESGEARNHTDYYIDLKVPPDTKWASLYRDPPDGLFPPRPFSERPAEDYLLPIGLLRSAQNYLGLKPLEC